MKQVILFFVSSLLFLTALRGQRNEFNKLFDSTIKVNYPNRITESVSQGEQRELSFSGLVPDSVFNKIIFKDYSRLGVISSALPQTSLLFDIGKKQFNANYSGFFSNATMLNGYPVAFNAGASLDFDDEAKRSVFISEGKFSANLKFSAGIKFFLPALAMYTPDEKKRIAAQAEELNKAAGASGYASLALNLQKKCDCKDSAEAVYKSYHCKLVRSIPDDTCITRNEKRYTRFLITKVKEMVQDIFMHADYSKKIYRWIGTDLEYDRPSVNTVNRLNAIDTRINTRIFNNTGVTLSYNVLDIFKKSAQYFIYSARYAHTDNSAALSAVDVNYNRRIETQGSTTYYESKTKKAYDTVQLKDTRTLTLGLDYYYFFKKVVGFSGSLRVTLGNEADVKRKAEIGVLFPIVQKDKTKTVLTIYYSMKSTSGDILNGRYPGELGFKVGVPIDMFTQGE